MNGLKWVNFHTWNEQKVFINAEFKNEFIDKAPLFPKLWTVLNFKVLTSRIQRSASRVQRSRFRVQRPGSTVQGSVSRVNISSFKLPEIRCYAIGNFSDTIWKDSAVRLSGTFWGLYHLLKCKNYKNFNSPHSVMPI